MVSWSRIEVEPLSRYCQEYFERYSEYPSVRDLFYRFIDELWPNKKSVYKGLSRWLRDQRLSGKIDWRIIRDGAGREYDVGDWIYLTPREHVKTWLDIFTQISGRYNLPRWLNQPKKVVVVCEKEADYPIVQSVLKDLNVDTFYERGYAGWRPLFETAERIKEEDKLPVIIALGDFDPSGEDIFRFLGDAFEKLGLKGLVLEKAMVTKAQIEEFKLPHRPEDEGEIKKLRDDPRFRKWPWGLYRVETAALRAKAPDYFDNALREAVTKHFSQEIYERVRTAEEGLRGRINEFLRDQEDLLGELRENVRGDERLE